MPDPELNQASPAPPLMTAARAGRLLSVVALADLALLVILQPG